jgi:hypothetical protein
LLVWDGSGLRCYLANFFFEEMVGVEEVALNPIGTRALTFIPRILQNDNQPHPLRFLATLFLSPSAIMASTLAIGLGVGVAAFLVCDGIFRRDQPEHLS